MTFLQKHAAKGQIVTGLLYIDPEADDLHAHLNTVDTPLNTLDATGAVPRLRRAGQDQRRPAVERFRMKRIPVRVKETRQNKSPASVPIQSEPKL